jgi:hypothetical protein
LLDCRRVKPKKNGPASHGRNPGRHVSNAINAYLERIWVASYDFQAPEMYQRTTADPLRAESAA